MEKVNSATYELSIEVALLSPYSRIFQTRSDAGRQCAECDREDAPMMHSWDGARLKHFDPFDRVLPAQTRSKLAKHYLGVKIHPTSHKSQNELPSRDLAIVLVTMDGRN